MSPVLCTFFHPDIQMKDSSCNMRKNVCGVYNHVHSVIMGLLLDNLCTDLFLLLRKSLMLFVSWAAGADCL